MPSVTSREFCAVFKETTMEEPKSSLLPLWSSLLGPISLSVNFLGESLLADFHFSMKLLRRTAEIFAMTDATADYYDVHYLVDEIRKFISGMAQTLPCDRKTVT